MKPKIAFVSADCFADVDMSILGEINKAYRITWYVVMKENARYPVDLLNSFAQKLGIELKIVLLKGRRRSLRNFQSYWSLFKELRFSGFELIYFEQIGDPYSFLFSLLISRSRKIYGIHDVRLHSNYCSFSNKVLLYIIRYSFKYIHVFSNTQKELLRLESQRRNAFVIPLSKKNSGIMNSSRPKVENGLRLLFFGGIHSYKRVDVLIKAIERLADDVDCSVTLTIAGRGPEWEAVKGLMQSDKLYNLIIDFIPTNDIPNLFNSHHFIVLPYEEVTQSGPLFDAFNFNLPAIVSDQPGFLEFLVDGKTGFVFKTNSVVDLYDLIKRLSRLEQEDYELLIANLKDYSQKYDSSFVAGQYSEMFAKVINS